MQLSVKTVRTISTDDLNIFCEPPLLFEARGYIAPELGGDLLEWEAGGYAAERAAELLPRLFLSVAQEGIRYPLSTKADALALRDAIEAANPGYGDIFLSTLLDGYWNEHYRFFGRKRLASASSQTVSANGVVPAA
jgi:hypothetical protein